jgi:Phage tail lysozyme
MAFTVNNHQNIFSKLKAMSPANRFNALRSQQNLGAASPFTLLTPTEFAELFPKYYLKGMPDVRGFYDAISKKKEGQELGGAGATTGATVSSSEKVTNVVKAKEIYDYLRSKGIDHNHATGIINNIKYESAFNSGAIGDHDTSGGLFQHHASRFSAMKKYVGDGWQTDWKKQVDFALTEGEMKTYLSRNYANAGDASSEFTRIFEKPANTETTAMYRSHTAGGYSDAMLGKGGEPAGGQTAGGNYEFTPKGFVVPKDKSMYDQGNEEQCATLSKGINPGLGRSSGWTIVEGPIKPGVVVATTRYNLSGADRTGAGYHTGVAMTAPDENGNFLLLEQFNGRQPQIRQVNKDSYDGGAMGGKVKFGLVQSNGRIHDEQSMEALRLGASLGDEDQRKRILSNADAIEKGGTVGAGGSGTGATGSVEYKKDQTSANDVQNNYQQQVASKVASTATVSDVMKMFPQLGQMGQMMQMISMITGKGEGVGDGEDIGKVSRPYESGGKGVHTVSSGKHDPGGVSYGEHQLASRTGTMGEYLKSPEAAPFAHYFKGMKPGSSRFNETYKKVAADNPEAFASSQHAYIKRTHYDPLEEHAKKLGFDTEHPRVKETLFSMGVQHGGAKSIVSRAKKFMGDIGDDISSQVEALFNAREKYTKGRFHQRYAQEKKDVLSYQPTATVKPAEKETIASKIAKPFKELIEPGSSMATEAKPATDGTSATEVFNRMRHMKPTAPEVKSSVESAPPTFDENWLKSQQMTPAKPDRRSMLPEPKQNMVSINPLEQRAAHMQPTPSLARAMDNARGVTSTNYTSLTKTQIG